MMSRLLTRREQFVLGFLAFALLAGSITVFALRNGSARPQPIEVESQADSAPVPSQNATPSTLAPPAVRNEIVVSIQGAIVKPGVYTVDADSRVHELIQMAGGTLPSADTQGLNLAARLVDGTTLTVPSRASSTSTAESESTPATQNPDAYLVAGQANHTTGAASPASGRIDLNTATQAQLESLPGIGPKLAQEIIRYREVQPFRAVSELDDVSGIGPAKLEAVRDLVTVN